MAKRNAIIVWFTLILFLIAVPAYSGMLDGKTFIGKNGEIGKKKSENDEIQFTNGMFLSTGCAKWGFGEAEYTTRVNGNRIFFTADIYSEKYGRITYSGVVKGESLEATFLWFNKKNYAKPEQVKWWKGKIKV